MEIHCVKSVCIRSYSGPHFPAFGLNAKRYEASLHIQSKCGKMWTRITPNTDFFTQFIGTMLHESREDLGLQGKNIELKSSSVIGFSEAGLNEV